MQIKEVMTKALEKLREGVPVFEDAIKRLFEAEPYLLGSANPPSDIGVYALFYDGELKYIGEAKGRKGLRDRLLSKHLSGDDSHTMQRVFISEYPDRAERREFLKRSVSAKWLPMECPDTVSAVERLLIWALKPEWNNK
jgi:hypothetical protein